MKAVFSRARAHPSGEKESFMGKEESLEGKEESFMGLQESIMVKKNLSWEIKIGSLGKEESFMGKEKL